MITLTIVIPFYNSAIYLKETLNSVKSNLNDEIELLIIDDGSTDNSLEIINQVFEEEFYNVKIFSRPPHKPKGANACRNYGLEKSQGKWVMFMYSDDLMYSTCIPDRIQYINQSHSKYDMYIFQTAFINKIHLIYDTKCNKLSSFEKFHIKELDDADLIFLLTNTNIIINMIQNEI